MINAIVCCHSLSSSFLSHFQYVQEGHIWGSQTSKEMEKMGLSQKKKQNKSYWTSFNPLPFILGCWPRKVRPVWVLPCFCPDVRLKSAKPNWRSREKHKMWQEKATEKGAKSWLISPEMSGTLDSNWTVCYTTIIEHTWAYTWIGCQRPLGSSQVGRRTLQRFCLPLGLWESLVQIDFVPNQLSLKFKDLIAFTAKDSVEYAHGSNQLCCGIAATEVRAHIKMNSKSSDFNLVMNLKSEKS